MDIAEVFDDPITSGVFLLENTTDFSKLSALANEKKVVIHTFDGSKLESKREFLQAFANIMKPPDTSTGWDYFVRQLELTEWMKNGACEIILYKNIERFHNANREEFVVLLNIFLHVTNFRNQRPHVAPLLVFLQANTVFDLHFPFESVKS